MSRYSVETVFKGIDRITSPVKRMARGVSGASRRMEKSLRGVNAGVDSVHTGIMRAGRALVSMGALGGAAAFAVGKTGAEFEQAITAVGAVSLKSRDQIADLEAKAKDLGATTQFTATEAANAMEILSKAGFEQQEILGSVGGVLSAAAASGLEIAEVADHVSNAMKGMGLEVIDANTGMNNAARVADVLALASSKTNSSIGSLGESLKNVAGTASDLGIPLEDTVGAVALLQDVGLDASVAGSAFNTMLTKIAAGTGPVSKKLKALGDDLTLPDILRVVGEEAEKSGGKMDRVALLAELVGLRGQKAASKLTKLFDSGKVTELTSELNNASGAAEKMAALRMNNTIGDMTLLGSAVDAVKVALFETESGPLRGIVQGMTEWVTKNRDLIVSGFSEFMSDLRAALPTIVVWLERIGKVLAVFYAFAAAIKIATAATTLFNIVMAANPLMLWAVGITAAIALIWAFWPEISRFFAGVWEKMKSVASAIADFLKPAFQFLVGAILILLSPLISYVKALVSFWKSVFSTLAPYVLAIWNTIKGAYIAVWDWIVDNLSGYIDRIKKVFAPIVGFYVGIWSAIADGFMQYWGWIFDKIAWAVEAVRSIGATFLGDEAPETSSPAERGAQKMIDGQNGTVKGEISVNGPPGTTAKVDRGSPIGLRVASTGAA